MKSPEGQVLYDDICFELTNYETGEDPETTTEEWVDVFYSLLVRAQNLIECGTLRITEVDDFPQKPLRFKCIHCGCRQLSESRYDAAERCSHGRCENCGARLRIRYNDDLTEAVDIDDEPRITVFCAH